MKKAFTLFLLVASGYMLSGCNTMSGMGKDIERGGEKVQNASGK
ncbi:MAG: entericidin A/B family lipoprotein [Herminiimonas sp.]|nr:entericidin A/B family lipoprotein [Herminiimonas sp.]